MKRLQQAVLLSFFKAVGQPERIKVLGLIACRPHTMVELAERLELRETAVTHHIKRLQKADLVCVNVDTVFLHRAGLAALAETVSAPEAVENDAGVLAYYLEGKRIKSFPEDAAERRVLLNWLADRFTPDRKYSRSRVDYMLSRHTDNQSLARRELLEQQLLQRRGEIYWRQSAQEVNDEK